MVWQAERRLIHIPCGTYEWEWSDPDAWKPDHVYCPFCKAKENYRKRVQDSNSADDHAGLDVRLYRIARED